MNVISVFRCILIFLLIFSFNIPAVNAAYFGETPGSTYYITSSNGLIWTKGRYTSNWYWNGSVWVSGNTSLSGRSPQDGIRDVFIDNQGRLWFSGEYNSERDQHTTGYLQINSPGVVVSHYGYEYFVKDKNGIIWTYGYPDGQYYLYPTVGYFNGEGFTHIPVYAPFRLNGSCLTVDHYGRPWVGGDGKAVAYWNGSSWVRCDPPFSKWVDIYLLATANDGSIIAMGRETGASGWAVYRNGTWTIMKEASDSTSGAPARGYTSVENGPDGKLWAVANDDSSRLVYYENGIWTKTAPAPFSIEDLTVDDSGIVWAVDYSGSKKVAAYIEGIWVTDTNEFSAKLAEAAKKSADEAVSEARQARISADAAKASADTAASNAASAKSSADTAASRVWDSSEGKSAATLAKEARDKANEALTAVNNMQTIITDIKNTVTTDNVPPSIEVKTLSGATATSGSSIRLVIAASDNKSANLNYNVNGGAYSPLPADGKVDVPLTSPGPNTIVIGVQDEAGNVATKAITI